MKKKKLIIIISALSVAVASVFAYFFFINKNPIDAVKSIPIGSVGNPPEYAFHIFGDPELPLGKVLGMTVANNRLYATDTDNGMVNIFDLNGKLVSIFGQKSKEKLMHPYGIAENGGNLYIGDGGLGKILIYDTEGKYIREFKTDEKVNIPGQIVIKDDKLYYPDLASKKIFVYDLNGKLLLQFGEDGEQPGQFLFPHGIAVDDNGNIFVADSGNNRVSKFNSKGKFKDYLLGEDGEPMDIGTPRGLSFDNKGNLYVVAGIENMVYAFNPDGEYLFTFNKLEDDITLGLPSALAVDGNYVFVSETESNRVAVFKY